jgi:hypothetical protein
VIQCRKFLDACQDWLMQNEDEVEHDSQHLLNQPWKFSQIHITETLGLLEDEVRLVQTANCGLCKKNCMENWKVGIGNPFTHAQFVLLCTDCHANI